jgi:hypothetical protein
MRSGKRPCDTNQLTDPQPDKLVDARTWRRVGRTGPLWLKMFPAVRLTLQRIAEAERGSR